VKKFIQVVHPSNKELCLNLTNLPHTKEFAKHQKLLNVKNKLIEHFSILFTDVNKPLALKMLQSENYDPSPKD